ncbi:MAG: sorbosone dehydrogenase family protein [Hellea sp.]|nr:sorbosone dehydrogenase family protein [Hellea sp.]
MRPINLVMTALIGLSLSACASKPVAPISTGFGPDPELPPPSNRLLPRVNVAKAEMWPAGMVPSPAPGLSVTEFVKDLDHPRWVYQLPNGDVLVAESNSPPKETSGGLRAYVQGKVMAKAGAGVPSANRITLLRDRDGDGVAELKTDFMTDLYSPFGMVLIGETFYIANADGIVSVPYVDGATSITETPVKVFALPGGPRNHHWTKNIIASPDKTKLYAAVGSNSNIAEHGMEEEAGRAAIWEYDIATGQGRLFGEGLRNPVGMDFDGATGKLYTVVNERDELGDNLVPDYLTSVQDGGFYGWPYSYFGQIVDARVKPQDPARVATAIKPDYGLGSHTASLGLDISEGRASGMASRFGRGAFIGQHGSWNRKPRSGYKVIFVPFDADGPAGEPQDVLTGFLDGDLARGRPVGVLLDQKGGLLVADDVGNRIWRVAPQSVPNP